MIKKIENKCIGEKTKRLDEFQTFQANNFKEISRENFQKLKTSIKKHHIFFPLVVWQNKQTLVDGHHRIKVLQELRKEGYSIPELPYIEISAKDKKELAEKLLLINSKYAKITEQGLKDFLLNFELSFDGLLEIIDLPEISLDNLESVEEFIGLTDDDEVPDVVETSIQKGDVYQLGEHLLLCGNSLESLAEIMGDQKADMVFTDPPYLMDYQGAMKGDGSKHKRHRKIKNDKLNKAEGDRFLLGIGEQIKKYCQGAFYISFHRLQIDRLMNVLSEVGLKWRNLIIWKKNHHNLSNSDYKALYEPILYGWTDDYTPIVYGWNVDHAWNGDKKEKDVWEISIPSLWEIERTKKNDLHPTMKPVELCLRAIRNSCRRREIVLDLFGGSGSTLIACEKTKRKCRMVELDEQYCQVIINRWQNFTGQTAIKIN